MRNRAGYGREKGAKAFGPPQIRRAMQRALVMVAISRGPVSPATSRPNAAAAARLDLQAKRVPVEPLLQWLRKTPKQEAQARCRERGTSVGYLRQVAYGYKLAGLIAADIELITDGECRRQDLRPHDFGRLWPELAAAAPQEPSHA